jgi:hypothetical protein
VCSLYYEAHLDPYLFQDYVFAFFISCYHLHDWMDPEEKHGVKEFADRDEYLGICRRICNGAKHFATTNEHGARYAAVTIRTPTATLATTTTGFSDAVCFPQDAAAERVQCSITTDRGDIDLRLLMDKCIESWDGFIQRRGLQVPAF